MRERAPDPIEGLPQAPRLAGGGETDSTVTRRCGRRPRRRRINRNAAWIPPPPAPPGARIRGVMLFTGLRSPMTAADGGGRADRRHRCCVADSAAVQHPLQDPVLNLRSIPSITRRRVLEKDSRGRTVRPLTEIARLIVLGSVAPARWIRITRRTTNGSEHFPCLLEAGESWLKMGKPRSGFSAANCTTPKLGTIPY